MNNVDTKNLKEEAPANSVSSGGVATRDKHLGKPIDIIDKRYKKNKTPTVLKRFKKFFKNGDKE